MSTAEQGLSIKSDPRALQFKHVMESDGFRKSLNATLPKHIPADKMIRVVLSAFQTNNKLLECTPESVLLSIMRAAAMGLQPDGGPLGQGYLVPFYSSKNRRYECQFIPGYKGLIKLARNSGEVADVWAEVVYAADQFDYELGLNPSLKHKRNDTVQDVGEVKYAYAVARFRDGERKFVVLNKREIDTIKATSSSKDKAGKIVGPWADWPAEMAKKTAVRRLAKMLPLSVEIATQISSDAEDSGTIAVGLPDLGSIAASIPYEPVAEQPAELPADIDTLFANAQSAMMACDVTKDVMATRDDWINRNIDWTPEHVRALEEFAEQCCEKIRAGRGGKKVEAGA